MQLYFLPDHLLVYQDRKYGAVSYSALTAADEPTQFIEADGVPGDAEVVGQTCALSIETAGLIDDSTTTAGYR